MELIFNIRDSVFHAIKFGNGKKLLICFHGFGDTASKFMQLAPALEMHFTIIAIDLPYHGTTAWKQNDFFMKEDLKQLINHVLAGEQKSRFSMLGYSLGAKLVLAAVHDFAPQLDEIILVAPDGVKRNAWYNIAVYPTWGQALFRRFVQKPGFVFTAGKMLKAMNILDERLVRFLQLQTDTQEKRQMVYDVWLCMKDFETDLDQTKRLLLQFNIPSFILIGKYDRIITIKTGERWTRHLANSQLTILEKGHNLITESLNEPLMKALGL